LPDVQVESPEDGQLLSYQSSSSKWIPSTISLDKALDDLTDVTISNPTDDQYLRYDGSGWVNETVSTAASLDDLTDVTITNPTDDQFLRHDGSGWVNEAVS